jgi:hypothetical protein
MTKSWRAHLLLSKPGFKKAMPNGLHLVIQPCDMNPHTQIWQNVFGVLFFKKKKKKSFSHQTKYSSFFFLGKKKLLGFRCWWKFNGNL